MFGDSKFDESEDFMNMFSSKKDKLPSDYHLFASADKVWTPPTHDKLIRKEYEIYYVEHTHEFFKTIKNLIEIDKVPIINIYVDSFRVVDNVVTTDSINGSGTLILPNDTLECLRQEITSTHTYSVEIKIDLGIFGDLMFLISEFFKY